MYCINCGQSVHAGSRFCAGCGTAVHGSDRPGRRSLIPAIAAIAIGSGVVMAIALLINRGAPQRVPSGTVETTAQPAGVTPRVYIPPAVDPNPPVTLSDSDAALLNGRSPREGAVAAWEARQYADAARLFDQAYGDDKSDIALIFNAGLAYERAGDQNRAVDRFDEFLCLADLEETDETTYAMNFLKAWKAANPAAAAHKHATTPPREYC